MIAASRKKETMRTKTVSEDAASAPHDGVHVLKSVNRKTTFGSIPLRDAVAVGRELYQIFGDQRIQYTAIGASGLGIGIAVPEAYLDSRPTSNLFEVQMKKEDEEKAVSALMKAGWERRDITKYFSITWADEKGEVHKSPTIDDQKLFSRKGKGSPRLFVTAFFLPTTYYRITEGTVSVERLAEPQTPGESLAHKLLRSAGRDRRDITQVALVNDLVQVFGESGLGLISRTVQDNEKARQKLAVTLHSINESIKGYKDKGYDDARLRRNAKLLSSLRHN